jgi:hypothetical protein
VPKPKAQNITRVSKSPYANYLYKVCKNCEQELDLAMFAKKSKYKYYSRCKTCLSKRIFSVYSYSTAEMQAIAKDNNIRIHRDIYLYGTTAKICRNCNVHPVKLRNAFCKECKQKAKRAKEKKYGPERTKRRTKRNISNLGDVYVRRLIKNTLDKSIIDATTLIIPEELIEIKRKQILLRRYLGIGQKLAC